MLPKKNPLLSAYFASPLVANDYYEWAGANSKYLDDKSRYDRLNIVICENMQIPVDQEVEVERTVLIKHYLFTTMMGYTL